jgi:hypothetical protein
VSVANLAALSASLARAQDGVTHWLPRSWRVDVPALGANGGSFSLIGTSSDSVMIFSTLRPATDGASCSAFRFFFGRSKFSVAISFNSSFVTYFSSQLRFLKTDAATLCRRAGPNSLAA